MPDSSGRTIRRHHGETAATRPLPGTSKGDTDLTTELDKHGRNLAERQLWSDAEDLASTGRLMARSFEGDFTY
jgi:hypothetical protein